MFVLITVTTLFCGWRHRQRAELQNIARKVQERDGTVFYQWQVPSVRQYSRHFNLPPREREYQVQVPYRSRQGVLSVRRETRTQLVPESGKALHCCDIVALSGDHKGFGAIEGFGAIDFLFGYHSDVKISAISMHAAAVDQETLRLLSRIENLDTLLLRVDFAIIKADKIARRSGDQSTEDFNHMCEELKRAKELVQEHLPSLSVPVEVRYFVGVGGRWRGSAGY